MQALGSYIGIVVEHSTTEVGTGGFSVENKKIPNTGIVHSVGPKVEGDIEVGSRVLFNNAGKWPIVSDEAQGVEVTIMDEEAILYLL